MDIVTRLKMFIDRNRIPVTQFADKCGIPRPSMSQLLSGRNKKVSDEVLTKIHEGYPSLPMMWLMFGEGDMTGAAPIASQPPITDPPRRQPSPVPSTGSLLIEDQEAEDSTDDGKERIDFGNDFSTHSPSPYPQRPPEEKPLTANEHEIAFIATHPDDLGKRVVSIVVYYDDNSYQSFVPDTTKRSPFR